MQLLCDSLGAFVWRRQCLILAAPAAAVVLYYQMAGVVLVIPKQSAGIVWDICEDSAPVGVDPATYLCLREIFSLFHRN